VLAHTLRDRIWAYCEAIGYDPWQAMIAMARSPETPIELQLICHREVAAYVLPKLKALTMTGECDPPPTAQSLQALFMALEQAEEQERAQLPMWRPPSLETLERH
jgi:hypothetical protein